MKINAVLFAAMASVAAGMALYSSVAAVGGCTHPGQTTLRVGQCLLDDGVLAEVLAALGKPDYLKQVEGVGLTHAGDLVDCALRAVSAQPVATSGSGSDVSALWTLTPNDTLSGRARQALAARRSAGR